MERLTVSGARLPAGSHRSCCQIRMSDPSAILLCTQPQPVCHPTFRNRMIPPPEDLHSDGRWKPWREIDRPMLVQPRVRRHTANTFHNGRLCHWARLHVAWVDVRPTSGKVESPRSP